MSASEDFVRTILRDPERLAERLALLAVERLGQPAPGWAEKELNRGGVRPDALSAWQRLATVRLVRVDGAIAGTPFFGALIPAYLDFLWQEATMVLRIAALYGHDPRSRRAAAELLVLRRLHSSVVAAERALEEAAAQPAAYTRSSTRRPAQRLRDWTQSVRTLLVFGGFLLPPRPAVPGASQRRQRPRTGAALAFVAALWVVTWVLPLTFMLLMSWGCESNARGWGHRVDRP